MRRVLLPAEGLAWDLGAVELALLLHLHRILAARRYSRDRAPVVTAEELARLRLSGPLSGVQIDEGLRGLAARNAAVVAPQGDVVVLTWAPWQGDAEDKERARSRRGQQVRRKRNVPRNIAQTHEDKQQLAKKVPRNIDGELQKVARNIQENTVVSGGKAGEKLRGTSDGAGSSGDTAYYSDQSSGLQPQSGAQDAKSQSMVARPNTQGLRYQPSLFGLDGDQVDQRTAWLLGLWEALGAPPFTLLRDAHEFARGVVTTYWGIDLEYQSKRMVQWWRANPSKHRKDVAKFIDNWFARQHERERSQNGNGEHGAGKQEGNRSSAVGRAGVIWED